MKWLTVASALLIGACVSSPQRMTEAQLDEVEEVVWESVTEVVDDYTLNCTIVDRVEASWIVLETGVNIPLEEYPEAKEGTTAVCLVEMPDIQELTRRMIGCLRKGGDVNQCMTEEG
jgi:predicted Zn-dependent protease